MCKFVTISNETGFIAEWLKPHMDPKKTRGHIAFEGWYESTIGSPRVFYRREPNTAGILQALIDDGTITMRDIDRAICARIEPAAVLATREEINRLAHARGYTQRVTGRGRTAVRLNGTITLYDG